MYVVCRYLYKLDNVEHPLQVPDQTLEVIYCHLTTHTHTHTHVYTLLCGTDSNDGS